MATKKLFLHALVQTLSDKGAITPDEANFHIKLIVKYNQACTSVITSSKKTEVKIACQ